MEMYKCPKCDTEFLMGVKFCEKCGCNLEVEFIETPTCPKCGKIFPTGTVFCSDDGTKLVAPEQMIPKCVKCGKVYTDGTKFCSHDGGRVIPEALRKNTNFYNAKELIVENICKGKKLIDKMNLPQKLGLIAGCITIIVLVIILTGGSPGKKTAQAYCKCFERELKKNIKDRNEYEMEREVSRCARKKAEKNWKHIEKIGYYFTDIQFKNPKHQREFEETYDKCMSKLAKKYKSEKPSKIVSLLELLGGSPGKKVAKAYCKCLEEELKKEYPEVFSFKGEIRSCFEKKIEKYWKYIEDVDGQGNVKFKNPKHQKEYEEALEKYMSKLNN